MSGSPPELPIVVLDALMPTAQRLVLNRRGSMVWEVESHRGHYAGKVGYPIEATADWSAQPWTALAPAREGAVLLRLGLVDLAYGEWERGTWNFQPWHEGPNLYQLWEPCRRPGSSITPHTSVALGCVEALAELHAKGWAHGDVQPAHFMFLGERREMCDVGREVRGRWGVRSDSSEAHWMQSDFFASPWAWISRFALSAEWGASWSCLPPCGPRRKVLARWTGA
ncbi:hypothetical protein QQM39_22745 [Streptomyces sp. DT2A-34]|uniref:hypothetical protein n=1 Tax=Streptomyces sp. DT2A-34 TaxID=3051182 RepID=UPI00265C1E34|nr:hypothetical protein [Streptomyces sp. DT2A-34]MDO0913559.1 hypothetical protein [Streptomyces sp. DT2A-34]